MAGISRRDMPKVSALGAAALALPLERTVRAKTASEISSKKIPAPYTLPFTTPPILGGRGGGTLTITQRMANAEINTTWDDIVASGHKTVVANPQPDEVQIWEITNKSGGWFHPTHIHLVDFKILSRNGRAPYDYELDPKDVATSARTNRSVSSRSVGSGLRLLVVAQADPVAPLRPAA